MLKRALVAFLALIAPGYADDASPVRTQPLYAQIPAHPALWTVHGPKGTAYLFGSIHALPPQVDWHTKQIDDAMAKADVLVFELPMDHSFQERVQDYVRERGLLPPGQHLRDMLSNEARKEFDAEVAHLDLPAENVDHMRPWLAALTFEVTALRRENYAPEAGVELSIENSGTKETRPIIGLETIEQQMALLAPDDPKAELQSFEASLATPSAGSGDQIGPLLDAWSHADVARLDRLTGRILDKFPQARKLLLDDRNKAWVAKISALLDEDKTYFITVGAAHLVGRNGVPTLLRNKGFRVDGP